MSMKSQETAREAGALPVNDVIELQNVIMGGLRQQQIERGRMVEREYFPRKYRFCMLDDSGEIPSENKGGVDTYLGVILSKQRTRYWSMLISFLEGANTEADALSNSRTLYRMDWTKTEAQGMTWGVEVIANSGSQALLQGMTKSEAELALLEGNSVRQVSEARHMSRSDIYDVRERVQEISSAVMMAWERKEEQRLRRRPAIL